jgi:uncharacterized protein (DUF433 family)
MVFWEEFAMRVQVYRCIFTDPEVLAGQPCIGETHLPVSVVVAQVAAGKTLDDIAHAHQLSRDAVCAALEFAAERASEALLPDDPLLALAGVVASPDSDAPVADKSSPSVSHGNSQGNITQ